MFTPVKGNVGPEDFVFGDQEVEDEEPKGVKGMIEKLEIGVKSKLTKGGKDAKKMVVKSAPKLKVVEKTTGKKTGVKASKTGGGGSKAKAKKPGLQPIEEHEEEKAEEGKIQGKSSLIVKNQSRKMNTWMSQ